ncbi:hypothetical protein PoB_007163400 [Plakobranchus ocellatus]|uniref:RHD domain-containing protein n=1 Tax=Plakobranchus ocellatus TaxID=259542 RepID=A0AAV4DLT5_9GAST|nr:hypothetical protein PoB_007163400 [Plakobranchus ocellatus]
MKPKTRAKSLLSMKKSIEPKEMPSEEILNMNSLPQGRQVLSAKPSVKILKCISFQKFRYSGENRPGKKYQDKEFMTLQLNNLADKVIRVVIICTDADNRELIHPNGLVGKDCHHGIYDQEYVITKSNFVIKIPYLRTERIKINAKKDEQKNIIQANNIQAVLSQRASHLPSPYKERCLSQCTEKYTSGRKFDTTKVCLGVIITVQSQLGEYNGSLHAISHMVRNASEKTSLEIHKLSQTAIPAWHGGSIDIFTNEDGPAIEPDKCLVYVTLNDVPGAEEWKSDVFSPTRDDILYKKVIRYEVPPIAPNHDISTPTSAILHLECPQSNQYCFAEFKYTPLDSSAGYICIDNLSPLGTKRSFEELQAVEDIKPSFKKLREDLENDKGQSETIKANLKTKLQARQENYCSEDEMQQNMDHMAASGDGGFYDAGHQYSQQHKSLPRYSDEQRVYVRHEDPQTGEASYLLDMDASKASHNSHGPSFQSHSQDVKVVATGYSDAVPPNTTVLIYTTNNGVSEQVALSDSGTEHMIVENATMTQAPHIGYRGKENAQDYGNSNMITEKDTNSSSEQIVRRDTVGLNQASKISGVCHADNNDMLERHVVTKKNIAPLQSQFQYGILSGSNTFQSSSFSPAPSKNSSAIPDIRRMVIPDKSMPETSPWDVGGSEDAEAYNICTEAMHYEPHRGQTQPIAMKKEFTEALNPSHANKENVSSAEHSINYTDENENTTEKALIASQDGGTSDKKILNSSKPMGLGSYLERVVATNLPTFEVSQIAETLVNGIDHVDAVDEDVS